MNVNGSADSFGKSEQVIRVVSVDPCDSSSSSTAIYLSEVIPEQNRDQFWSIVPGGESGSGTSSACVLSAQRVIS